MVFRTKFVEIGLIVGITCARAGIKHGIYFQSTAGVLAPIVPFPQSTRKPTLQELAQQMATPRTLGEKIRYLRLRKGLRQNELAKALGVYNTAVCQWEKDLTEPRPAHMGRLSQLLASP